MKERYITESIVERVAFAQLESLGWRVTHRHKTAHGESKTEWIIGRVC